LGAGSGFGFLATGFAAAAWSIGLVAVAVAMSVLPDPIEVMPRSLEREKPPCSSAGLAFQISG